VLTNCGRTATIYLLEHCMKFGEDDVLLLPDYLDLSIIVSLEAPHVKYRFYRIKRDLSIDVEDLRSKLDEHVKGIYLIEYFGVPYEQEVVDELKRIRSERNIPIVEDITQTLLSRDGKRMGFGEYLVCSTRKWMPMTDGGLMAARDDVPFKLAELEDGYDEAAYKELLVSLMRDYYDAHPDLDIKAYSLLEHDANMTRYMDLTVRGMTAFSRNIMFACDVDSMVKQRRANYNYLYERLENHPEIIIGSKQLDEAGNYVPFGLFLLVEDRDAFKNYLLERRIIGGVQWTLPLEYYEPGEDAKYLSAHNLMIPCDQCYTEEDMRYVADSILSFFD
jgi:dTDP-4-amino-4,6-dideoxygalactose transaminase